MNSIPIILAPLAEQKRIADKLDAVLGRVDACRARLDRVPALLKRFRQSVLAAATSGKLTEEWRMTNGVNDEWEKKAVGSIVTKIEAGLNVLCDERPPRADERGLVKISAVTWGTYNDDKSKTLPPDLQVPESTRIKTGDFLISRANTLELVGACVIVHKVTRPVYLSDKILRLVLPEDIKPWLLYVLQSPEGRRQIEDFSSGNQLSMRNLAQGNLRQITLPFPSEDERKVIIQQVEELFALADRIEARLAVVRKTADRLTPSVLAKAFRGELVPQDPNDEPASVLLERLQSQAAPMPARAPRKKRASKASVLAD
jgi:type I restriction enzyme S subunit